MGRTRPPRKNNMSLKAFHVIFVAASILLGVGVGGWGIHQFSTKGDVGLLVMGIIFLIMGIVLIIYGKRMLKKTKNIGYLCLAGILFSQQDSLACATCFGESEGAMAEGMNAGVMVLLVVVGSMLAGIGGFFIFLVRRGARVAARHALLRDPRLLGIPKLDLSAPIDKSTQGLHTFQ
jgi:hypothetical protein